MKTRQQKIKVLDDKVSARLIVTSKKYPTMCTDYLIAMRKVIDWAEKELKKIHAK
jgi:hypothetical protein